MTLSEAAEELNAKLRQAEFALQALALGVSAEVPLWTDAPEGTQLGYGKQSGEWILYLRTAGRTEVPKNPVTKVSRESRVQVAKRLGALLEALMAEGEQHLAGVQEASKLVDTFIERVSAMIDAEEEA